MYGHGLKIRTSGVGRIRSDIVKPEDFDYAYDLLKKNIELFNKVTKSKLKLSSKESYLKTRKYNDEN
ncbi:hypothetical protein SAMN05444377_10725 [Flavobacterium fontis]|uniref:Uncharacterized protein n=1 Tax=Flavobacterium fontis TaxID=1124188 RepID=A0A1M5AWY0_9FLAO|nr:hypothetical protein [Flavobacterium fontis]SHF34719.1 hypothetical protein SAMN05444377_10725 [Flavobacterium fontis]